MGNHWYAILRVLGKQEERQRFVQYVLQHVPSRDKRIDPDEEVPGKINQWYVFKMWENESGTFMTFLTNNTTVYYTEGYQLHKLFPQLKFIFRSIDEGFPNHCGMWEFAQDDPISDELEADLKLADKFENAFFMSQLCNLGPEHYQRECLRMCGNDLAKTQRIHRLFQSLFEKKRYCFDDSETMNPVIANDKYFEMTPDELQNAPEIPECTETWRYWKHYDPHNDSDYDYDDEIFSFVKFKS